MGRFLNSKPFAIACSIFIVALAIYLGFFYPNRPSVRYDRHIKAAAKRYDLDPALIKAVIWQESKFKPWVRGKAGEIGLMQVREDAAFEWAEYEKLRNFNHEQITDPEKNIYCGSFYLSKVMKRYKTTDNPIPYALADYNAGRSHVLRWNKGAAKTNSEVFMAQMDFPGTRKYAQSIMKQYEEYKLGFEGSR
ncbi:MAG TPA: lytic transglycosylase domain-containing protein [Candidatus Kapabacteria bacterium]|nr:lytic transglycosylase domain-containing protein [Candidatus Kapabacteria bacterium]